VIRFGLRLAVAGGREAVVRLVITAAAVALGVGLLLATIAGVNGVNTQNARYAWLNTGFAIARTASAADGSGSPAAADPLWWDVRGDYFDGLDLGRVDVAATGPHAPVPPGIPALPGPGEFYASPALVALLAATPSDQLADRFPGHLIGIIGPAALPAPNSLVVVIGHTPGELSGAPGATEVTSIATMAPSDCDGCVVGLRTAGLDLILSVVAAALLFPVLIFIGAATRLTATRRELRFAAMRLVGATPRQVSVVSAVESVAAAVLGTAAGFGLFFALRGPIATIPFTGAPFFPSDLSLTVVDILAVALGVPVAAALSARLALRRVHISPLGITRRVTPRPPRWYRLIPLALGLGDLAWFVGHRPPTTNGQILAFLPAFLVIMAGLVIAGPWLTMVGARVLAGRARRPAALIAARRMADNPRAAFRAISGLILALFVTSVAVGVITTIVANRGGLNDDPLARSMMFVDFPRGGAPALPDGVPDAVRATAGVRAALVIRANPAAGADLGPGSGLVLCADLVRDPDLGRCADGATVAQVPPSFQIYQTGPGPRPAWPSAPDSAADFARQPVASVVVDTDGTRAGLERVRTALERALPYTIHAPATEDDFRSDTRSTLAGWQQLANVVVLASLPIAGCSLAVSVAGGLSERKRPFALLRLAGVPLRVLRRVVTLESAVPLLVVAAIAIGTGLLAADLFLRAQMGYPLRPLGAEYYVTVAAGLVASLAIIASTLPLLERITGPETARNE
jgi:hypothetical protein